MTSNATGTTTLPEGTTVTYLTTMYNSGAWDYVETVIDGKVARGFVPSGYLDIDDVSVLPCACLTALPML